MFYKVFLHLYDSLMYVRVDIIWTINACTKGTLVETMNKNMEL